MVTTLRRVFWLALLGGVGYAGWFAWQTRRDDETPIPEWPPLDAPPAAPVDTPSSGVAGVAAGRVRWVEPVDGACPDGYPVKANDKSGIFHVPGGRFYDRTVPERCYADTEAAEADGYRRSKA